MVNTAGLVKEIETAKEELREEARENGIWENFGQNEVRRLEDKYSEIIDPYAREGTKERRNHRRIERFNGGQ